MVKTGINMRKRARLVDSGYELISNDRTITLPVLAVLDRAAFKVTPAAMDEYRDEENRVEVRNDGCTSDNNTPAEAHGPVGNIVLRKNNEVSRPNTLLWI